MNFKTFRLFFAVSVVLGIHVAGLAAAQVPFAFRPEVAESVPLIQADQVHQLGITGAGVGVAVLDSFVLPASPLCGFPHGAWVEGIIRAVAPGAQVFRYNVESFADYEHFDCFLDGDSIVEGLRQILSQHRALGIKVVNLSIGSGRYHSPCFSGGDEAADIIESLIAQGVIVVAASGNEGFADALIEPACLSGVISVGAVYDHTSPGIEKTQTCAAQAILDAVTCYSNAASFLDVLAPGDYIKVLPGVEGLGTSAATPHVAGVAALLLQVNPALSPGQVESLLKQTGKPVFDARNGLTFPRINALAAVQSAMGGGLPSASPKGDVNLDGQLDRQDVRLLSSAVRGRVTLTPAQAQAGDVAAPCDGQPNKQDIRWLQRMIRGRATSACASGGAARSQALQLSAPVKTMPQGSQIRFEVNAWEQRAVRVQVFALSGRLVFEGEPAPASPLRWSLLDKQGQRVPNGVYLLVVSVSDGRAGAMRRVNKLAVLR